MFVPLYTKCGKANPQLCSIDTVVLKLWHSVLVRLPIDTRIISGFVRGLRWDVVKMKAESEVESSTVFDVHGSVNRKSIFKYNQQDTTLQNLFISVKSCTCFRRLLRPSSGAQTVYTASGTLSKLYCHLPLSWKTVAASTKYAMLYIQF